jgi:hypothetical protein
MLITAQTDLYYWTQVEHELDHAEAQLRGRRRQLEPLALWVHHGVVLNISILCMIYLPIYFI